MLREDVTVEEQPHCIHVAFLHSDVSRTALVRWSGIVHEHCLQRWFTQCGRLLFFMSALQVALIVTLTSKVPVWGRACEDSFDAQETGRSFPTVDTKCPKVSMLENRSPVNGDSCRARSNRGPRTNRFETALSDNPFKVVRLTQQPDDVDNGTLQVEDVELELASRTALQDTADSSTDLGAPRPFGTPPRSGRFSSGGVKLLRKRTKKSAGPFGPKRKRVTSYPGSEYDVSSAEKDNTLQEGVLSSHRQPLTYKDDAYRNPKQTHFAGKETMCTRVEIPCGSRFANKTTSSDNTLNCDDTTYNSVQNTNQSPEALMRLFSRNELKISNGYYITPCLEDYPVHEQKPISIHRIPNTVDDINISRPSRSVNENYRGHERFWPPLSNKLNYLPKTSRSKPELAINKCSPGEDLEGNVRKSPTTKSERLKDSTKLSRTPLLMAKDDLRSKMALKRSRVQTEIGFIKEDFNLKAIKNVVKHRRRMRRVLRDLILAGWPIKLRDTSRRLS